MHDTIIVGGGLFGSIIGAALDGTDYIIIDDRQPEAGSGPAACLMKPSWFSSMGREVYEPALRTLSCSYEIKTIEFAAGIKALKVGVHWIDPRHILDHNTIDETVLSISSIPNGYEVVSTRSRRQARNIVVAAGIWTEKLFPKYKQQGQKGIAFTWKDQIEQPFITPWAPYRQMVVFNRGSNEVWSADGTAIKAENWTTDRARQSIKRVTDHLVAQGQLPKGEPGALVGIRPYAKDHKPCLLVEEAPGLWLASGGAKNGTMAAGYCAHVIKGRIGA